MSRTVFVVTTANGGEQIEGIFDDRELADQFLSLFLMRGRRPALREWPLNPFEEQLRQGLSFWYVIMNRDGNTISCTRGHPGAYAAETTADMHGLLHARLWAKDGEHATQIADEHRRRRLAQRDW